MKGKLTRMLLAAAVVCMLFTACGSDDDDDTKTNDKDVTEIIGDEGGAITSADNNLVINIPAGVMTDETSVTVTVNESNEHPDGVGTMFTLESAVDQFEEPVTLTFSYTDESLPAGMQPEFLTVVFREEGGEWITKPNATLDKITKTITVQTDHFSQWSLASRGEGYIDVSIPIDTFAINIPADRFVNANGISEYSDTLIFYFQDNETLYKSRLTKIGNFEIELDTELAMQLYISHEDIGIYSGPVDVVFSSLGENSGDVIGATFSGDAKRLSNEQTFPVNGKFFFQLE